MRQIFLQRARVARLVVLCELGALLLALAGAQPGDSAQNAAKQGHGQGPFTDWNQEQPGNWYRISPSDLPKPYATEAVANRSTVVPRPANQWPKALPGFKVELMAGGLDDPRQIVTAPNGDLFFAESGPGLIRILRGVTPDGKAKTDVIFASGLMQPYGIAFYPPGPDPQYVYVGDTDSVVRFPYRNGDLKARGPAEPIAPLPHGGLHWTRNLAFSKDGKKLFVSVGSHANVADDAAEKDRADVLELNPDGSGQRIYAYGIRNPSGLTIDRQTGQVWVSVNERDGLGDNLPPDYITHVQPNAFYGWPWFYLGPHQDPRFAGKRADLKDKVIVPDVLLQSHSAPLSLIFYNGKQFPAEYRGNIFATCHGSWNRAHRTGYKIIRVPMRDGKAVGDYQDFVTGFVVNNADVWGRPVGITVASDGSLVFTDDASNSVWRVSYEGGNK